MNQKKFNNREKSNNNLDKILKKEYKLIIKEINKNVRDVRDEMWKMALKKAKGNIKKPLNFILLFPFK